MELKWLIIRILTQTVVISIGYYVDGVTLSPESVDAWEGSNVTLQCSTSGNDGDGVRWYRNGISAATERINNNCKAYGFLRNESQYSINCSSSIFSVTINEISRTENGYKWICLDRFWNERNNTVTTFVKVMVQHVTIYPSKKEIIHIENVTVSPFQCVTNECRPEPTFLWYKDRNTSSREDDILLSVYFPSYTSNDTIKSYRSPFGYTPNRTLDGWYIFCAAQNNKADITISDKILMNIVYPPDNPPRIAEAENEGGYTVIEGTTVNLTCSVTGGNPLPRLEWSRNNNVSQYLNGSTIMKTISWQAYRDDRGILTCTSIHFNKIETEGVKLIVLYRAKVINLFANGHKTTKSLTVAEYDALNLTCEIEGDPFPEGEMTFSETNYTRKKVDDVKTTISSIKTFSNLYLTTAFYAKCTDAGQYTCVGWNTIKNSKTMSAKCLTLFVKCKPRKSPFHELPDVVYIAVSNDVTLSLTVLAYPMPTESGYVWFKKNENGEWISINITSKEERIEFATSGLQSNLTIKNITRSDYGLYKLVVENDVGTYEHTFKLTTTVFTKRANSNGTKEETILDIFTVGGAAGGVLVIFGTLVTVVVICKSSHRSKSYSLREPSNVNDSNADQNSRADNGNQNVYEETQIAVVADYSTLNDSNISVYETLNDSNLSAYEELQNADTMQGTTVHASYSTVDGRNPNDDEEMKNTGEHCDNVYQNIQLTAIKEALQDG